MGIVSLPLAQTQGEKKPALPFGVRRSVHNEDGEELLAAIFRGIYLNGKTHLN
jgi:hypothetical protein